MGYIKKILKVQSGLKARYGFVFLKTYREQFHFFNTEDEVVVQLAKRLFPAGKMPKEITVTVQWQDST